MTSVAEALKPAEIEAQAGQELEIRPERQEVAEPVSEQSAIFSIIERAARDPNVDLDKMERLMAMRQTELDRQAKIAFFTAMKNAQAEMKPVVRDADNDQTKSKYARYETISDAIQPIITKHGFSLSFDEGTPEKENHIRVLCDVMHEGGYSKQYHGDVPFDNVGMKGNANKTATHAYGSTKSYGKRYLKCDIFDVSLKNADDDGNAAGEPESVISEEQAATIRKLIEETGTPIEKFCEWAKIDAVPDLLSRHFDKAVRVLQQRRKSA